MVRKVMRIGGSSLITLPAEWVKSYKNLEFVILEVLEDRIVIKPLLKGD